MRGANVKHKVRYGVRDPGSTTGSTAGVAMAHK